MRSIILTTATRYLLPLMLMFSLFILLRGHNDPGGGFIGGLVASAAFALYGFAFGIADTRKILRMDPLQLIGVGLLMVAISGIIAPIFRNEPFLTAVWGHTVYPAIGKLSTPLLFDTGIYIAVIGVILLIIFTIAEESGEPEEA